PRRTVARIQKMHPQARILGEEEFEKLLAPTADEFLAFLRSGPHDYEFWDEVRDWVRSGGTKPDLSGIDLRNLDLSNARLDEATLDGANLSNTRLAGAWLGHLSNARLDGSDLRDSNFDKATGCSLKNVNMTDLSPGSAEFTDCDFSGAVLRDLRASYAHAAGCKFARADMANVWLDESDLRGCDLSGADLTAAQLKKCDLTGANLSRADLTRADLREANLVGADLRKCKLNDAVLSGADLTDAKIQGADFTGANLTGATVAGLDPRKAKNFVVRTPRPVGPTLRELARVAKASKRFLTSIRLDLGDDGHVDLEPSLRHFGGRPTLDARFMHESPNGGLGSYVDAPTFEQGMLNLADRWDRGTPDFDSVRVEAKNGPLRGAELRDLAVAAWHEAFGRPVPTPDEQREHGERRAAKTANLRDTMLAELRGGPAGVKKWNARPDADRANIGSLRRLDLTGAPLAAAILEKQDLRGAQFDRAVLRRANINTCKLQGASFAGADLTKAYFGGSKAAEVSFEGATLTRCNMPHVSLRRANFRGADLTRAILFYSDLCGADFTGAILDGTEFGRTRFDDKTVFPPGFVPPEGLVWKGPGPRPGLDPQSKVFPPDSLDFAGLFTVLTASVEAARLAKAKSMLKAERFQLFADVTADALVGIVKSQSSKDRVYSCRLAADGSFACCTQNLKPCGGLRGAACKHLLVLALGLAKAGAAEPATVAGWLAASKARKPAIDPDRMTEAFLKYKGAEAGEVDWRPTETLPEDFYAM
ncbi:MAG TPA: pentapeptide repeat-containing protein, partial [Gemmataceae bacterium]|nr:pentapeptide repeat-containing protein [Gemmataceae bacterium]